MSGEKQKAAEAAAAIDLDHRIGDLPPDTCRELLESTPIGRVGFVTEDGPLVLPVNYRYHEDSIVFRTVEGEILAGVAAGVPVCFEVDEWDAEEQSGWSVVVRGQAAEVTEWADKEILENLGLTPWARNEWRRIWIRVTPTEITGRALRGRH